MAQFSGMWTLSQVAQAIKNKLWTGQPPSTIEYLVVAGGGGGGSGAGGNAGGGGGAGGVIAGFTSITQGTQCWITVGSGGSGAANSGVNAVNGGNSVLLATSSAATTGNFVALGGGYGATANSGVTAASSGGSGGGGPAYTSSSGGSGTSGQGNAGGNGSGNAGPYNGGGGGGASTVGFNFASTIGGNGGAGIASSINGTLTIYGGGGAGGGYNTSSGGTGGVGGGGNGGNSGTGGVTSGSTNTGGGGGGTAQASAAGSGGSGIVIIRYSGNQQWFTGGTLSYDSVNNYTVHSFYSSGSLTPLSAPVTYGTTSSLTKSLRFIKGNTPYLSKTPSSNGSRTTATFSAWVKRGKLGSESRMFSGDSSGSGTIFWLFFNSSDQLQVYTNGSGVGVTSTAVYKDPSAWYHIVATVDTTQANSSDRLKLYVNGVQVTSFTGTTTYWSQNASVQFNSTSYTSFIGFNNGNAFDGYMADVYWIDGQALTPQSFGTYDATTGVWSPMAFSGVYGTNGVHLPFTNTTSTTTLGYDTSGNGNNWSTSGFSLTAGSTYDSMNDVPTLTSATASNYATLNPNDNSISGAMALSNGNLETSGPSSAYGFYRSTIACSIKMYYEVYCNANVTSTGTYIGFALSTGSTATNVGVIYYNASDGKVYLNNTAVATFATYATGDLIGCTFDPSTGNAGFYKNNTLQGTVSTSFTGNVFAAVGDQSSSNVILDANFGQQPFVYTPPSGYVALNTYNLPTPTIVKSSNYFSPILYLGNRPSTQQVGPLNFQPDFVWIKGRNNTWDNSLFDSVRGASKDLVSNTTAAEITESGVSAFNSGSFNVGSAPSENQPQENFVAWCWSAGAGNNVSNTSGSITSTVSANQTSGFSIVTYTGTGANATIGHGLGAVPSMIIIKCRNASGDIWPVYHVSLGNTQYLRLNTSNAAGTFNEWQNTTPTSSVFYISTDTVLNTNGNTYVAYCFAPIAGFSAIGSYTGNGSATGPFVYCGFQPAYVIIKNASQTGPQWWIIDNKRDPINPGSIFLSSSLNYADYTISNAMNLLSNGFQITTTNGDFNTSGNTIVYMAFAQNPFRNSNAF